MFINSLLTRGVTRVLVRVLLLLLLLICIIITGGDFNTTMIKSQFWSMNFVKIATYQGNSLHFNITSLGYLTKHI
jgi:hypothetical protein